MKRKVLILLLTTLCFSNVFSQITDTVYFDMQGEIIIKEVASIYRVAQFDTTNGKVIGAFNDYKIPSDSLIGTGSYVTNPNGDIIIENFTGDSVHYDIALVMQNLNASFIRINDYPYLKKVIKPFMTIEDRTVVKSGSDPKLKDVGDFVIVEARPEFPGGMENLGWFIGHFLRYPEEAQKNNITGIVKVKFLIDKDGALKDFSILEGIGYGCDEEAIRVMKLVPDWLPGLQRGKPVKTYLYLPISFQ